MPSVIIRPINVNDVSRIVDLEMKRCGQESVVLFDEIQSWSNSQCFIEGK